jgi:hypothetical protein
MFSPYTKELDPKYATRCTNEMLMNDCFCMQSVGPNVWSVNVQRVGAVQAEHGGTYLEHPQGHSANDSVTAESCTAAAVDGGPALSPINALHNVVEPNV